MLDIPAPILGKAVSLEQVPDPAFAEKQMGQGIAIEPGEGKVFAPFDGKVAALINSKHGIILEHATGVQILIHVGIGTVSLKGKGFTAYVETGDEVKAGQQLLAFDRDIIGQAGYPLITPIIVPDGQEMIERVEEVAGDATRSRETILRIHLKG